MFAEVRMLVKIALDWDKACSLCQLLEVKTNLTAEVRRLMYFSIGIYPSL